MVTDCIEITMEDLDNKLQDAVSELIFTSVVKEFKTSHITKADFEKLCEDGLMAEVLKLIRDYFSFIGGDIEVSIGASELYHKFLE